MLHSSLFCSSDVVREQNSSIVVLKGGYVIRNRFGSFECWILLQISTIYWSNNGLACFSGKIWQTDVGVVRTDFGLDLCIVISSTQVGFLANARSMISYSEYGSMNYGALTIYEIPNLAGFIDKLWFLIEVSKLKNAHHIRTWFHNIDNRKWQIYKSQFYSIFKFLFSLLLILPLKIDILCVPKFLYLFSRLCDYFSRLIANHVTISVFKSGYSVKIGKHQATESTNKALSFFWPNM